VQTFLLFHTTNKKMCVSYRCENLLLRLSEIMHLIDEDTALVDAALKGSAHAWEKLVRRYEDRIYNQGLRLTGSSSDAMDLMQEVFLGVYGNLHRFRGDAKFSSWIFRIAHNKAIDMQRRKRLMPFVSNSTDQDGDMLDSFPGHSSLEAEEVFSEHQKNKAILSLLSELPMNQRLIVELKIFQSQTFEEIASIQEVSVNTVKTRFYSSLKKLKTISEEKNVLS
jgi:RNA polymerase sigma-70 factor (ECF subfamily)